MTLAGRWLVGASVVIAEGESKHDGEPEDGADDHKLGSLGTIASVHEVENDQRGFDRGDSESDDDIELMEVLKCRPDRNAGAEHQRRKNDDIDLWRNNVLGHARLSSTMPVNQI